MTDSLVSPVPGRFGFTSVRAVGACADVERTRARALRRRGVSARAVCADTRPVAPVPRRAAAAQVRAAIAREG